MKDSIVDPASVVGLGNSRGSSDPIFHAVPAPSRAARRVQLSDAKLVVGIEGEGWWSGLSNKSTDNSTSTIFNGIATATEYLYDVTMNRNRWDATLSLRGGYAVDRSVLWEGWRCWGRVQFFKCQQHHQSGAASVGAVHSFLAEWEQEPDWNVDRLRFRIGLS